MARALAVTAAFVVAAAGVVAYALAPGVGTFQLSFLLVLPAMLIAFLWLHRRLPMWLQWSAAIAIAPVGPIAYLIWGGDQWWNWGQATPTPLILLLLRTFAHHDDPSREPWYGGYADGPFGPP